jgi:nucleotide-binding universal stress UspA family protein
MTEPLAVHSSTWLPRTVLVPLDGSEASRDALPLAHAMAQQFGAEVATVAVDVPELDGAVDVALSGDAIDALLAHVAGARDVLVCMASHGRRGLGRRLVGSVAEGVIRACPAPVIVVGPDAADHRSSPRSILTGIAWPPGPDRLLSLLAAWAPALQARVELAHVRAPSAVELYAERVTGHGPPDRPDLGQLAATLAVQGVEADAIRLLGPDIGNALRDRADKLTGPVLIAVDSHRGGHDANHDVTYQLIRQSRWPVLATTGTRHVADA